MKKLKIRDYTITQYNNDETGIPYYILSGVGIAIDEHHSYLTDALKSVAKHIGHTNEYFIAGFVTAGVDLFLGIE